jgi:hypothetical protein
MLKTVAIEVEKLIHYTYYPRVESPPFENDSGKGWMVRVSKGLRGHGHHFNSWDGRQERIAGYYVFRLGA